ncbi:L-histidine N(alpha)-methyltransferase [bacterium]|nr:L-histidine N(alpha)-methyltransferase [bacterium]
MNVPHPTTRARRIEILAEVQEMLSRPRKELPCKLFYDRRGSEPFDSICGLAEYYPTRTELAIMRRHAGDMIDVLGSHLQLAELGSGSSLKTRLLLDRLEDPSQYVPIDISCEYLQDVARVLAREYPWLKVIPLCSDYTVEFSLPDPESLRRVIYFPGSTIGNFHPPQARELLNRIARVLRPSGALLIGVDLRKDRPVLEAAYNDRDGVTAQFNINVLARLNRELGANFNLDGFRHDAFFNEKEGRIEMHLVSRRKQRVRIGGLTFTFAAGESIHTESSYKYTPEGFAELAASAALNPNSVWTDDQNLFSVQAYTPA